MRIGFDLDGVLVNFIEAYQRLVIETAHGLDLFQPGDNLDPPCWNWPEYRGYSADTMKRVWATITASRSFWYSLKPLADCSTLGLCIQSLEHEHDIYYITSRPGPYAKRQTEAWLRRHLPYPFADVNPTVLIASDKGAAAAALRLDAYIDDNLDNVKSVLAQSGKTRTYLLNKRYNQGEARVGLTLTKAIAPGAEAHEVEHRYAVRVNTLGEMLTDEFELIYAANRR